jgi:hypothetical protein
VRDESLQAVGKAARCGSRFGYTRKFGRELCRDSEATSGKGDEEVFY